MGLASIQASVQDVHDLLATMADSDATPDSLGPDIKMALELLSKVLADAEETSDVITGKAESMDRISVVLRQLKEDFAQLHTVQSVDEAHQMPRAPSDDADTVAELEKKLKAAEEKAERWEREADLRNSESDVALRHQASQQDSRLRDLLSRPVRDLREILEPVLRGMEDGHAAKVLAAAFDNLHVKILKLINAPLTARLPGDLLGF